LASDGDCTGDITMPGPPTPTTGFVVTNCSTLANNVSSILIRGHGDIGNLEMKLVMASYVG